MSDSTLIVPESISTNPLTLTQLGDTFRIVEDIIDLLDPEAMAEICSGNAQDVDDMLAILIDETAAVISSQNHKVQSASFGYLDRFTASVEESLRCKSFNYFILSVLPDFILGWHNIEWGNLVQMYRLLCILAARDHGKSYEFSFAYPLWQMYRYRPKGVLGNNVPKELQMAKEGLMISNELKLSRHFLAMIKEEIFHNPILKERLEPESKHTGWGSEKIVCKNGSTLSTKSAGSKIRGYHPTYIVLDDFLNESSLYSQEQRDKYWNKFSGVILPALSPGGQMVIVGTPFFEKDLYAELKNKKSLDGARTFPVFEYPAIFPDGRLLFPQRHTFESLMEKRDILGSLIFSREILVKPISDGSSLFPYETLNKAIRGQGTVDVVRNINSSKRKFVKVGVGLDFAISANIGADYSAFAIGGLDDLGNIHVLNLWRKQGAKYNQQVGMAKKINRDFRPDIMFAEDNAMQQIFIDLLQEANLPVVGKTTTAHNKKSLYKGVPRLAALFETGRIKFPYGTQAAKDMTDLMFSELNSVTYIQDTGKLESVSQNDDTAMALWNLVRALIGEDMKFDFSFV